MKMSECLGLSILSAIGCNAAQGASQPRSATSLPIHSSIICADEIEATSNNALKFTLVDEIFTLRLSSPHQIRSPELQKFLGLGRLVELTLTFKRNPQPGSSYGDCAFYELDQRIVACGGYARIEAKDAAGQTATRHEQALSFNFDRHEVTSAFGKVVDQFELRLDVGPNAPSLLVETSFETGMCHLEAKI